MGRRRIGCGSRVCLLCPCLFPWVDVATSKTKWKLKTPLCILSCASATQFDSPQLAELLPSSTNPPLLRPRLAHLSQLDSSTHTSDPTFVEYVPRSLEPCLGPTESIMTSKQSTLTSSSSRYPLVLQILRDPTHTIYRRSFHPTRKLRCRPYSRRITGDHQPSRHRPLPRARIDHGFSQSWLLHRSPRLVW